MKVNDLFVMESAYNNRNNIGDVVANLRFPQKYITLEYGGVLYNLDIVSVDEVEFIVRVLDGVGDGRK